MRKIKQIFKELLNFFLIFLFFFVWLRYFIRSLVWSMTISALLGMLVWGALFLALRRKEKKSELKEKEKEDAENMFLSLAMSKTKADFFLKLAKSKHENVQKFANYVLVTHDNGTKTLLHFNFDFEDMNTCKFAKIAQNVKNKAGKVVILCYSYSQDVVKFAQNFDVSFVFFDRFETYQKLYKFYGIFPLVKEKYKKEKSPTFRDFISISLNHKRAKGYVLSAIILTLSAFFVHMTIYYCIMASLLLLLALASTFNVKFNTKEEKNVL